MKALILTGALVACTQLSGCFFVFIPVSLIAKASDAVTGAEGEHCVGRAAVVGSKIRDKDGSIYTVKSLSGTSVRCTNPDMPIRAALSKDS
jgi:hypothetical protein